MRSTVLFSLAVGMTALSQQGALADPAYTADRILQQFAPAPDLGPTRSLCIGTESECAKAVAPSRPTANSSFDLVVTFEYNSDRLTSAAKQNLDEFARALKDPRLSRAGFSVEGHTDGKGGDAFNVNLSQRRAEAVVAYLAEKGADGSKLQAKGLGKAHPRVSNPLDPSNRRVETRLRVE